MLRLVVVVVVAVVVVVVARVESIAVALPLEEPPPKVSVDQCDSTRTSRQIHDPDTRGPGAGFNGRANNLIFVLSKAGKDRDTVSVEPGSRRFFGSVSVSESQLLGILCPKDTFCVY